MAESLGAKHRKLNDLRRAVPVVSKSALAQVLGEVAEHGLPPVFNTKAMRQGAEADLAQWNAYGDLLQNVDAVGHTGETVPLTLVNFWTLLHASYKIGGFFSELLKKTMAKTGPPRPDKPYNLILYSDECYPGNPLAHRSEKKSGLAMLPSKSSPMNFYLVRTAGYCCLLPGAVWCKALLVKWAKS